MKDKNARVHEIVNAGPMHGMSEAFDAHMGAECWTDSAYAPEAVMWAAAWKAAKMHGSGVIGSGGTMHDKGCPVNNAPAWPGGVFDCGVFEQELREALRSIVHAADMHPVHLEQAIGRARRLLGA